MYRHKAYDVVAHVLAKSLQRRQTVNVGDLRAHHDPQLGQEDLVIKDKLRQMKKCIRLTLMKLRAPPLAVKPLAGGTGSFFSFTVSGSKSPA